MLKLDNLPQEMEIKLFTGSDFYATILASLPAGSALTMEFETAANWVATITGNEAVFDIAYTVADLIPDGEAAELWYTNGSSRQCYAKGRVRRYA